MFLCCVHGALYPFSFNPNCPVGGFLHSVRYEEPVVHHEPQPDLTDRHDRFILATAPPPPLLRWGTKECRERERCRRKKWYKPRYAINNNKRFWHVEHFTRCFFLLLYAFSLLPLKPQGKTVFLRLVKCFSCGVEKRARRKRKLSHTPMHGCDALEMQSAYTSHSILPCVITDLTLDLAPLPVVLAFFSIHRFIT